MTSSNTHDLALKILEWKKSRQQVKPKKRRNELRNGGVYRKSCHYTEQQWREFHARYMDNPLMTFIELAAEIGVSEATISKYFRRHGLSVHKKRLSRWVHMERSLFIEIVEALSQDTGGRHRQLLTKLSGIMDNVKPSR